jgi:hypothetical protein
MGGTGFADLGDRDVLSMLRHPGCPSAICTSVLRGWGDSQDHTNVGLAAAHRNCPPELVEELYGPVVGWAQWCGDQAGALEAQWVDRRQVVHDEQDIGRLHWSLGSLQMLAERGGTLVQMAAASNPYTPSAALQRLVSHSQHADVLAAVAQRLDCPPETLWQLSDCSALNVKKVVAGNPVCPPEVLERLSRDASRTVLPHVASNPRCPPDTLGRLSCTGDELTRLEVAKNVSCPSDALERLLRDSNPLVSGAAERNPNLPRPTLAMWQLAHPA